MGKWAARLQEKTCAPPLPGTVKTDERGVLSVSAVTPRGGAREFEARALLPVDLRGMAEPVDPAAVAWTDADIARFLDRRTRLMRWGWAESEAETLADRLVRRDREQDDRVNCTDCANYRPGRCGNHRRAGLQSPDVGRDLAMLLQRCPGFESAR